MRTAVAERPYHALVLIKGLTAVARRRRPVLIGVLILAVVLGILVQAGPLPSAAALFVLVLAMIVLAFLVGQLYHPAVLTARPEPPAILAAPGLAPVFSATAFMLLAGVLVTEDVSDIVDREELWGLNVVTVILWVLVVALHLHVAWGSYGVRLTPEGVHDRQPLGSLFVPWEAFAPDYPAVPVRGNHLTLYYQRPDLVRQRGLRPSRHSLPSTTDATYLANVIHQYVSCPERRPDIGTEAELRRLTA